MMKRYLLPQNGTFYKANLHTHTTISDAEMTPQEVKRWYKDHGYSVVAYTDHDVLLDHSGLAEEGFLPLNGFEVEIDKPRYPAYSAIRTCHICMIAKDPKNLTMPIYHRTKYMIGNGDLYRDQIKFDESQPDYEREYTPDCINDIIRRGKEAGFFVTYNHPTCTLEPYPVYMSYQGMDAMEIMNYGATRTGAMEYNARVYDDMLQGGKRVFAVAADDTHSLGDCGGGWVMIKAEKLEYTTITKALERGDFYASFGPEIKELWIEDDRIHIRCAEAIRVVCSYGTGHVRCVNMQPGVPVTEADFPLKDTDGYFRLTVIDDHNRCADTNAYFLDQLR